MLFVIPVVNQKSHSTYYSHPNTTEITADGELNVLIINDNIFSNLATRIHK